ncbi:hypothetical protein EDD86DRAFT_210620 [Gorgonomyces haynaldii]|nr:hypothetical protein EDD86DRAFT_210620 [Gorgonomyces haynaldii]
MRKKWNQAQRESERLWREQHQPMVVDNTPKQPKEIPGFYFDKEQQKYFKLDQKLKQKIKQSETVEYTHTKRLLAHQMLERELSARQFHYCRPQLQSCVRDDGRIKYLGFDLDPESLLSLVIGSDDILRLTKIHLDQDLHFEQLDFVQVKSDVSSLICTNYNGCPLVCWSTMGEQRSSGKLMIQYQINHTPRFLGTRVFALPTRATRLPIWCTSMDDTLRFASGSTGSLFETVLENAHFRTAEYRLREKTDILSTVYHEDGIFCGLRGGHVLFLDRREHHWHSIPTHLEKSPVFDIYQHREELVLSQGNGSITRWDIRYPRHPLLAMHVQMKSPEMRIVMDCDESNIAAVCDDGCLRVWDLNGQVIGSLECGPERPVKIKYCPSRFGLFLVQDQSVKFLQL